MNVCMAVKTIRVPLKTLSRNNNSAMIDYGRKNKCFRTAHSRGGIEGLHDDVENVGHAGLRKERVGVVWMMPMVSFRNSFCQSCHYIFMPLAVRVGIRVASFAAWAETRP
jgi:hypothetical protein